MFVKKTNFLQIDDDLYAHELAIFSLEPFVFFFSYLFFHSRRSIELLIQFDYNFRTKFSPLYLTR